MQIAKLKKIVSYVKQNDILSLAFQFKVRLLRKINPFAKKKIIENYDELFGADFGYAEDAKNVSTKTINWFIPPVHKGSGGHLNIFRFINNLEELGYRSNIIIVGGSPASSSFIKRNIEKWFFPIKAEVFVGLSEIPASYFSMATSWPTAYYVKRFQASVKKCYFVQDFEPWFYASGTESVLAENTYRFGFYGITAGDWLANKLFSDYGMSTSAVGFSFEKELYKPIYSTRKNDGIKRIFFYARPPTPRRAFELGLLVLNEICKEMPNIEVIFAGWDLNDYAIPFSHKHAGLVALENLAELYCQCDVALVLSFSNVSLLPLELMACGVPVVSNKAPYTEWLLKEDICMMAEPNIASLKQSIIDVLTTDDLAKDLRTNAYKYAQSTSWIAEANKFSSILSELEN